MIEKVNPKHPDKLADRIAGALVDLAYSKQANPRVAIEILLGHYKCYILGESSYDYKRIETKNIVTRIGGDLDVVMHISPQDRHLSDNQKAGIRCGDNGIFRGVPLTEEQIQLSRIARDIYSQYHSDGKYILDNGKLIICQSHAGAELAERYKGAIVNPLGYWTGGTDVDSGATNRKLGSDMADSITGGGIHGKDLSKADVSVNIYAFLKAQKEHRTIEISCAIGDEYVDNMPYEEIVNIAKDYINKIGGFEKLAEWGFF